MLIPMIEKHSQLLQPGKALSSDCEQLNPLLNSIIQKVEEAKKNNLK